MEQENFSHYIWILLKRKEHSKKNKIKYGVGVESWKEAITTGWTLTLNNIL